MERVMVHIFAFVGARGLSVQSVCISKMMSNRLRFAEELVAVLSVDGGRHVCWGGLCAHRCFCSRRRCTAAPQAT
jgi:hypothetical protein